MAREETRKAVANQGVTQVSPPALTTVTKQGTALLDYLLESGTPPERLEEGRAWLLQEKTDDAEALYRHMEAHDGQTPGFLGTLRKAGKWVWGDTFEPHLALAQVPEDEIKSLRKQVAHLETSLKAATAEKLGYMRGRDLANERANDLQRQLAALKVGRSSEELCNLGIK